MMSVIFYIFLAWSGIAAVLLMAYLIFAQWVWQGWYYIVWPICAGGILWRWRERIKRALLGWSWPPLPKYILIVYIMVVTEEILAATFNHLSEGYDPALHLVRIGQFCLFNVLAFSGAILATGFMFTRYRFSFVQMFCVVGLFGQFSEKLVFHLFSGAENAIAALVLMPLNFWIYGIIFMPALLLAEGCDGRKDMHWGMRFPLLIFLMFAGSVIFVSVLMYSRSVSPELYPPYKFIQ